MKKSFLRLDRLQLVVALWHECSKVGQNNLIIYKNKHGMGTQGRSKKRKHCDMHYGKMVYALTQHALWNRKHILFLLCKCKRGEAVRNGDHVCKLISHKDYLILNKQLSKQWYRKQGKDKKRVNSIILMLTTPGLI